MQSRYIIAYDRWNSIGAAELSPYQRRYVNKASALALSGKSVLIRGVRGVGKRKILDDVRLSVLGKSKNFARIDMDDPAARGMSLSILEEILDKKGFFRTDGEKYLLVDEIERIKDIDGFARFLKNRKVISVASESTGIDCVFQGNGVFEKIDVLHCSFGEYIGIITGKSVDIEDSESMFEDYLRLYSKKPYYSYFYLLEKTLNDIVLKNEVRNFNLLTDMAVYLLSNPSIEISANTLKSYFSCSIDQARAFISHFENSGLIFLLKRIEDIERPSQASRLCIPGDVRISLALVGDAEKRNLAMVAVHRELRRICERVFIFKVKNSIGFCLSKSPASKGPVPMIYFFVSYPYRFEDVARDIKSATRNSCPGTVMVLSSDREKFDVEFAGSTIMVRPIWQWVLLPEVIGLPTDMKVDNLPTVASKTKKDLGPAPDSGQIPSHLL